MQLVFYTYLGCCKSYWIYWKEYSLTQIKIRCILIIHNLILSNKQFTLISWSLNIIPCRSQKAQWQTINLVFLIKRMFSFELLKSIKLLVIYKHGYVIIEYYCKPIFIYRILFFKKLRDKANRCRGVYKIDVCGCCREIWYLTCI